MELNESKIIRKKLMDFLSRREHSDQELKNKLARRVSSLELLEEEISKLKEEGLISNKRFAEAYIQSRKNKGFGSLRIERELQQRGIKAEISNHIFLEHDWIDLAEKVAIKKLKNKPLEGLKAEMKIKQFLNYRGFSFGEIEKALDKIKNN